MTVGQNRIPVNLDYAASTPMRAEALLAQREYDDSELAGVNPNSLHSLGRKAAARLEVARREIARSFGARVRPSEIVLTNGGTEANQLALLGLAEGARQRDRKRDRVIVSAIEHDSILDNLPLLRAAWVVQVSEDPQRLNQQLKLTALGSLSCNLLLALGFTL